ncbi:MAG: polymorphic toxin type 10 domain-containing protein [Gammaproteobacteria bacterium]
MGCSSALFLLVFRQLRSRRIRLCGPGLGASVNPVSRTNPGFAGRGKTRGGAREFIMPNAKVGPTFLLGS